MRAIIRLLPILLLLLSIGAGTQPAGDPVWVGVQKALSERTETRNKARTDLLKAIEDQIKAAGANGDLDTLKTLTDQKDRLVSSMAAPTAPSLKDAAAAYQKSLRIADGRLIAALESGIDQYTTQHKTTEAGQLRQMRGLLLAGQDPTTALAPAAAPPPKANDPVANALIQAKSDYQTGVNNARNVYLAAIDARLRTATGAGDLKLVTILKNARAAAETDTELPDEVTDPAILTARNHFIASVRILNGRLVQSFETAVREYTRAKKLVEASGVQTELDATGLKAEDAGAGAGATSGTEIRKFAKVLPPQFEAHEPYAVVQQGGIRPKNGTNIRTKRADFLAKDKDWVFDVWYEIERKSSEHAWVGIGTGAEPESIGLQFRHVDNHQPGPFIVPGGHGDRISNVKEPGIYITRVERIGGVLTLTVAQEKNGALDVIATRTFPNPKDVSKIEERAAYLFFGGGVRYIQFRLAQGPSAVALSQSKKASGAAAASIPVRIIKFDSASTPPAQKP